MNVLPIEASQASGTGDAAAMSAYLEAALDAVVLADASGCVVEFNPAAERIFGYTRAEALGRTLAELIVPPSLRERHQRAFTRFVASREPRLFGQRLELTGMRADGSEFPVELALSQVESEPLLICGALRDLSEAKRAEADLRRSANQQAALRRLATLVAHGTSPPAVFAAVAEEVAQLLEVPLVSVVRYESDEAAVQVGVWGTEIPFPVGTRWTLDGPSVMATVLRSGRPAKIDDYANLPGSLADAARTIGMRLAVGAPIVVDGRIWGAIIALSAERGSLPADTESRLVDFTEVVATSVSSAQMRDDLRRLADFQAALRRVATLVAQEATPADVFAAVAEEAARILDVPLTSIFSFEADGTATKVGGFGANSPFPIGGRYPPHPGAIGEAWRTGRPSRVSYAEVPGAIPAELGAAGIRVGVAVPITVEGETWGALLAMATERRPLPPDAESRLTEFTEMIATAISNAEARDELRRLADEHDALRRVATLVAEQGSPTEVFTAVAEEARQTLDLPLIVIARYEPDDTIAIIGAAGEHHPFQTGTRLPLDPGISSLILQTGLPAKVDYRDLPGMIAEAAQQGGFRTGLGVPIVVDGAIWGAIATASTAERELPDDTEARLANFTELVATAISNAHARDELRHLAREQAALRRVATLIARQATPEEIFAAVAKEVAEVLSVPLTAVVRYGPERVATQVGVWGRENPFPVGTSWTLDDQSVSGLVFRTGKAARVNDYSEVPGRISTALAREAGIRTAVGVPILVDGSPWGVMMALSTERQALPTDTETRLAAFTGLIATAISNTQARDDVRRLAEEQAALRRVATLVASGAEPRTVFDAVCEETGRLIGATSVNLAHFTPDGFNLTMAGWSLRDTHVPTGTRLPLRPGTINDVVRRTAAPGRVDSYEGARGELAALLRQRGIRSEVGAPVLVEGHVWGALIAGTDEQEPLPPATEARLASFAELIGTAVSNTTTRAELVASRARIVAAGDQARRRIERDLHDGTQQRLVSLGLDLAAARAKLPTQLNDVAADLDRVTEGLEGVLEEVREISRGLHPAMLSRAGLPTALKALARRSSVPVELKVDVEPRPDESIEIATYFLVSEALANAAKHANASSIVVSVTASSAQLRAIVQDDGIGGADPRAGSGLLGLVDRVEALGGRLTIASPPGEGTTIDAELPLAAVE